jgi:hypothetical protein
MSISGTTETCEILTNTPFVVQGGLNEINLSTINITDENGLDVEECFGISTDIITVDGTNVTLTGECDTSLEILITQGINNSISCDYVSYEIQKDDVLIFTFEDGSTSTNIHPDCCTSLGYDPEIGPEMWWICVTLPIIDPLDCDNYTHNGIYLGDWAVFDFITGGTVTTVPSAQCCYDYGLVDLLVNGEIKCVIEQIDPCEGYTVIEPIPLTGPIPFTDPNGQQTVIVPTAECCTNLGYNFMVNGNGFTCYQNSGEQPTVSITNDLCCQEDAQCYRWEYRMETNNLNSGDGYTVYYIDSAGNPQLEEFLWGTGTQTGFIYAREMTSIDYNSGACWDINPPQGSTCGQIVLGQSHPGDDGSFVSSNPIITCSV